MCVCVCVFVFVYLLLELLIQLTKLYQIDINILPSVIVKLSFNQQNHIKPMNRDCRRWRCVYCFVWSEGEL